MSGSLVFTQTVNASAEDLYWAFSNAMALREWLCDNSFLRAEVGGPLVLTWNGRYDVTGFFTALEKDRKIAFSWNGGGDPGATAVEVALEPQGDGTLVTVQHSGFGEGEAWEIMRAQTKTNWQHALNNLKSLFETGLDRRIQDRPMLGIYPTAMTADAAKRLGVPVEEGVLITNVVEGMGAQQAGLQGNDVIVSMEGSTIKNFNDFNAIVSRHIGGDTIPLEFYRGAEKHSIDMTLTKRPAPEVPATPADLAARVREVYAESDAELDAVLADVPEAVMAQAPAPGEWSVNQVLAHLIWSERYLHVYVHGVVGSDDNVAWPSNDPTHIGGTVAVRQSGRDLLAELKHLEQETAAQAAAIPAEFVTKRRGSYTRLCQNVLGWVNHTRLHITQIREAVEAVKQTA